MKEASEGEGRGLYAADSFGYWLQQQDAYPIDDQNGSRGQHDANRCPPWVDELRLVLRLPGQKQYRQGMISFDGVEEWKRKTGLLSAASRCVPLVWGEDDPIPMDLDIGSRVTPEPDGSVRLRLRRAYHEQGLESLVGVRGSLTYQPIDGLYLPPIDIEIS